MGEPSGYFGMHIAAQRYRGPRRIEALATQNSQVRDRELRPDPSPRSSPECSALSYSPRCSKFYANCDFYLLTDGTLVRILYCVD